LAIGDPRREDLVEEFKLPILSEEDASDASLWQFLGLGLGVIAVMVRNKYAGWMGALFNVMAITNQKSSIESTRSGLSSISFSFIGLMLIYNQMFNAPRSASIFDQRN